MSSTGPKSATPPPADPLQRPRRPDSHHSGQTQVVTTVFVPHEQIRRVNRTNRPSAPAGRGVRSAQKGLRHIQVSTTGPTT